MSKFWYEYQDGPSFDDRGEHEHEHQDSKANDNVAAAVKPHKETKPPLINPIFLGLSDGHNQPGSCNSNNEESRDRHNIDAGKCTAVSPPSSHSTFESASSSHVTLQQQQYTAAVRKNYFDSQLVTSPGTSLAPSIPGVLWRLVGLIVALIVYWP